MKSALRALAWVACLLALPTLVALSPIDSGDAWWHLAVGHRVLDTGSLVRAEPFSHTARGAEFTPQEWLSQVVLAGVDRAFGLGGVRVLTALLVLGGGLLIWRRGGQEGLAPHARALTVAVIAPALVHLVEPRPHMFSFVLFGAYACLVLGSRAPSWRAVAASGAVAVAWANFHAVGVLAPVVAGAAWAEALLRRKQPGESLARRSAVLALAAGGVLLNPSGFGLYVYAFSNAGLATRIINEWQPFWFSEPPVNFVGWPAAAGALLAVGLGVFAIARGLARRDAAGLFQAAGLSYLVLSARRWLWLGWVPSLYGLRALPDTRAVRPAAYAAAFLLAAAPAINPRVREDFKASTWAAGHASATIQPKAAGDFLDDLGISGRLYHPYLWGGYFVYRLHPAWQVYLYGETAVFAKAGVIQERQQVEFGPPEEALAILDRREVRALVVPRLGLDGKPARPPGGDRPGEVWIRAFANLREVVWLRRDDAEALAAAKRYYDARGIRWNRDWGFLEHEALLGNPVWCRVTSQMHPGSLDTVLRLAAEVRANPANPDARAIFLRVLQEARFSRSARLFEGKP